MLERGLQRSLTLSGGSPLIFFKNPHCDHFLHTHYTGHILSLQGSASQDKVSNSQAKREKARNAYPRHYTQQRRSLTQKGDEPMDKVIITAAITGSRITRDIAPNIPYTPDEIIQSSIECWNAGASIVHIHVRDPKTGLGTQDLELFRQVVDPLREKTDLVLCLTTSGIAGRNLPIEARLVSLELKP